MPRKKQREGMDVYNFTAKTTNQEKLWDSLNDNVVTLCQGYAGVGKTLVVLHYGLSGLADKVYNKVVYVRSDIGIAGQRGRGYLPGTLEEKQRPLLYPVIDNLPRIMPNPGNMLNYLIKMDKLEMSLLEDIRGRSFENSFVIFDEAQNATPDQIKTVLSRIGKKSSIVIMGDSTQKDSNVKDGLTDAIHRLGTAREVGVVRFTYADIVRNSVLANLLRRYEK